MKDVNVVKHITTMFLILTAIILFANLFFPEERTRPNPAEELFKENIVCTVIGENILEVKTLYHYDDHIVLIDRKNLSYILSEARRLNCNSIVFMTVDFK